MKTKASPAEARLRLAVVAPECTICGRCGTTLKYLGCGIYRHEDCGPGSLSWCLWYDAHPETRTPAGDILRASRKA